MDEALNTTEDGAAAAGGGTALRGWRTFVDDLRKATSVFSAGSTDISRGLAVVKDIKGEARLKTAAVPPAHGGRNAFEGGLEETFRGILYDLRTATRALCAGSKKSLQGLALVKDIVDVVAEGGARAKSANGPAPQTTPEGGAAANGGGRICVPQDIVDILRAAVSDLSAGSKTMSLGLGVVEELQCNVDVVTTGELRLGAAEVPPGGCQEALQDVLDALHTATRTLSAGSTQMTRGWAVFKHLQDDLDAVLEQEARSKALDVPQDTGEVQPHQPQPQTESGTSGVSRPGPRLELQEEDEEAEQQQDAGRMAAPAAKAARGKGDGDTKSRIERRVRDLVRQGGSSQTLKFIRGTLESAFPDFDFRSEANKAWFKNCVLDAMERCEEESTTKKRYPRARLTS